MHISRLFIERPIMTALVVFAILLFGIVGYRALPVAALPSVDYPTVQVGAGLPGASPETMASSVATPLEREFSTIADVKQLGATRGRHRENPAFTVPSRRHLTNTPTHRSRLLAYRNGAPSRLAQLGAVVDDVENNRTACWFGGKRSIMIAIQKQPGSNAVEVA